MFVVKKKARSANVSPVNIPFILWVKNSSKKKASSWKGKASKINEILIILPKKNPSYFGLAFESAS